MEPVPPLDDDEILLRRIRAPFAGNSKLLPDGSRRPNSDCMAPRKKPGADDVEEALSCTRLRFTSPSQLLEQLRGMSPPIDPTGWGVCWLRHSDVVRIADGNGGHLEVRADPTETDPGHCGIYAKDGKPCPTARAAARRLAKIACMLTDDEIVSITVGGTIVG